MRIVISDTGPLLHLLEAQLLDLLQSAGEIYVPPAVASEISRLVPQWSSFNVDWIIVTSLIDRQAQQAEAWGGAGLLDPGEAEALALAQQLSADWFLTDDAAARAMAGTLGIEAHGSLGIVLWAAATGRLDRAAAYDALDRLAQSSLWISARILTEARQALVKLAP